MDAASDNWFTLDVAGDVAPAGDASSKVKGAQDLERLLFGDNFSARIKASGSNATSGKTQLRSKNAAQKPPSSQKKKATRPRAGAAASDDSDGSSGGDDMPASSDDDARSSGAADPGDSVSRVRAPAWQDEDDDTVQACASCALWAAAAHVSQRPSGGPVVQAAHEEAADKRQRDCYQRHRVYPAVAQATRQAARRPRMGQAQSGGQCERQQRRRRHRAPRQRWRRP